MTSFNDLDLIVDKCSEKVGVFRGICWDFFQAKKAGEILLDSDRGGWIYTGYPLRKFSVRASYFRDEDGRPFTDCTGQSYLLEFCPFCTGEVPQVVQRVSENNDAA